MLSDSSPSVLSWNSTQRAAEEANQACSSGLMGVGAVVVGAGGNELEVVLEVVVVVVVVIVGT
jgi:hypothetical protein